MLFDLLSEREAGDRTLVFDIALLARRLELVTQAVLDDPELAALPMNERWPWFGRLDAALTHPAADVPAALEAGHDLLLAVRLSSDLERFFEVRLGSGQIVELAQPVSGVSFETKEGVNILKGYMESGEFSRGRESIRASGSIVLVGNFEVDVAHQQRIGHLLRRLRTTCRPALNPLAGIGSSGLIGRFACTQTLQSDGEPLVIHHREHAG